MDVKLTPFLRNDLDVLFVGLNPPRQSNENGHYFSGEKSRFFYLLFKSDLIQQEVGKLEADDLVFESVEINYENANFGITDLVLYVVETKSKDVKLTPDDLDRLVGEIRQFEPRFVCIIHNKVKKAFNNSRRPDIIGRLDYGCCGRILDDCGSVFFVNYFPNGNNIKDAKKIEIFERLRESI